MHRGHLDELRGRAPVGGEAARRSLASFVPKHVQRQIAAAGAPSLPYAERVEGAVLLSDVRGFTQLTERMAERGPDGVETLTGALNRYFGGLIDRIDA